MEEALAERLRQRQPRRGRQRLPEDGEHRPHGEEPDRGDEQPDASCGEAVPAEEAPEREPVGDERGEADESERAAPAHAELALVHGPKVVSSQG